METLFSALSSASKVSDTGSTDSVDLASCVTIMLTGFALPAVILMAPVLALFELFGCTVTVKITELCCPIIHESDGS